MKKYKQGTSYNNSSWLAIDELSLLCNIYYGVVYLLYAGMFIGALWLASQLIQQIT